MSSSSSSSSSLKNVSGLKRPLPTKSYPACHPLGGGIFAGSDNEDEDNSEDEVWGEEEKNQYLSNALLVHEATGKDLSDTLVDLVKTWPSVSDEDITNIMTVMLIKKRKTILKDTKALAGEALARQIENLRNTNMELERSNHQLKKKLANLEKMETEFNEMKTQNERLMQTFTNFTQTIENLK